MEHPIIFNTENVKAILDNRKTQTRRVIKPQPKWTRSFTQSVLEPEKWCLSGTMGMIECPYGQAGDRLWVREIGWISKKGNSFTPAQNNTPPPSGKSDFFYKKISSIHMPRWAARITLEIIDVRVERLQEIKHEDCFAEGIISRFNPDCNKEAKLIIEDFRNLWNSIHKKQYRWEDNPWVWVISFKK